MLKIYLKILSEFLFYALYLRLCNLLVEYFEICSCAKNNDQVVLTYY